MKLRLWRSKALRRRMALVILVTVPALLASEFMAGALPVPGNPLLDDAVILVFGLLTAWVAIGFWTAIFGFFVLFTRRSTVPLQMPSVCALPESTTAIVVPVYKESAERVTAAIEVMYRGLEKESALGHFEFYILSDSDDPDACVREQWAWAQLCRTLGTFKRVHYRRRQVNIKRKTGNIADFLRRWGSRHDYMIVLDADSLMSAATLVKLVALMEINPTAGIIQTAPGIMLARTLFGRIQQFANRLYGPMYAAGLSFWQLGDSYYWGHNAIIRVAPFMQHCALPRLRGRAPLSGDILSHDFVEAALMRRAGWSVWLMSDIAGSWEETPPTLLDELKRDRRWCHGNLQHLRLLLAKGMLATHRLMFINGAMSYIASLLWFIYLLLGTAVIAWHALIPPNYFPAGHGLFPVWPVWHQGLAVVLLALTVLILFLPKLLAVALTVAQRRTHEFGGLPLLFSGVGIEFLHSALLAPVRMLFHSRFVLASLSGRKVSWGPQQRQASATGWREALRYHALGAMLAFAWAALLYALDPGFLWWLLPVLGSLILALPVSVYTSRVQTGQAARRLGLFATPEERTPTAEISLLQQTSLTRQTAARRAVPGFQAAITDPYVNAVIMARLSPVLRRYNEEVTLTRALYRVRLLRHGPTALNRREQLAVLGDRGLLEDLHGSVWASSAERASLWSLDIKAKA